MTKGYGGNCRALLLTVCILLLSAAVFIIAVMAPKVSLYEPTGVILLPAANLVYLLAELPAEVIKRRDKKDQICRGFGVLTAFLAAYMLFVLIVSGEVYLKQAHEKMRALAYGISKRNDDVTAGPGDDKLCVVGKAENGCFPEQFPQLRDSVRWTTPPMARSGNPFPARRGVGVCI